MNSRRLKNKYITIFQCCGSGMFIPDPKTATKERGEKICCHTFFGSPKFHIIENVFIFEMLKKKIWANFQRIIDLFTQKIVIELSKIWVWNPGSGKNLFRIQDPRIKKAPDPGSGSATLFERFQYSGEVKTRCRYLGR